MSDGQVTFGWVISPTLSPFFSPEETSTPTKAGRALMAANERWIEAIRPHFDTIWAEDHFQWDERPVVEAVTTLTYLAGRHPGMRFGNIVLGQSYRNPALTAKMAATLHMLTGGRVVLGLGAGHERRMIGTRDIQWQRTFSALRLREFARGVHFLGGAGDDNLPGAVQIGQLDTGLWRDPSLALG